MALIGLPGWSSRSLPIWDRVPCQCLPVLLSFLSPAIHPPQEVWVPKAWPQDPTPWVLPASSKTFQMLTLDELQSEMCPKSQRSCFYEGRTTLCKIRGQGGRWEYHRGKV